VRASNRLNAQIAFLLLVSHCLALVRTSTSQRPSDAIGQDKALNLLQCQPRGVRNAPVLPSQINSDLWPKPSENQGLAPNNSICVTVHVSYSMSFLNLQQLPFVGMSYEFVGEKEDAPISAYIVNAQPGQGPPLHTHPYVEVAFVIEGCATITVGNEQRKAKAGEIVVIPENTPHRFVNSGDTVLRQIDIHASPKFIQTNLE
jgi:quercetin dioxygenase-like cupin family protein